MSRLHWLTPALIIASSPAWAMTLEVPAEHPSIQAALDAAIPGDVVLVAPGIYYERPVLRTGVVLLSSGGPFVTTIDGGGVGHVIDAASPHGSISSGGHHPHIEGFTITGAGSSSSGVWAFGATNPTIARNVFHGNPYNITCAKGCAALITGNLLTDAYEGIILHEAAATITNNTVAGVGWMGVRIGKSSHAVMTNNLIIDNGYGGVYCEYGTLSSRFNNVWNNGTAYNSAINWEASPVGTCAPGEGDRSVDPRVVDRFTDFRLSEGSPLVDAGDNAARGLSGFDLDGASRIHGASGSTTPRVDIGAFEHGASVPCPDCVCEDCGPELTVTGTCPGTLVLTLTGMPPHSNVRVVSSPSSANGVTNPKAEGRREKAWELACDGQSHRSSTPSSQAGQWLVTDAMGGATWTMSVSQFSGCDRTIRAIDMSTCDMVAVDLEAP